MRKQGITWVLALALTVVMAVSAGAEQWAVKADYTESCSCNAACPCNFGSPPTLGHCEGTGLLEIKEGHYGDVRLDGITVVATLRVGEWIKYYVDEDATDEQAQVVPSLVAAILGIPASMETLTIEKVPVSVERTATRIKFSVPASTVEIEQMKGRDGQPIRIQNLPSSHLAGYTQYKSITNQHHSKDQQFSYSGTNGLTSKVEISSEQ